jgi:transposase
VVLGVQSQSVVARVASAVPEQLAASVLLRELRERGYVGGYTILKDFLQRLRPVLAPEPVVRFETAPGEQMQVDWASLRRGPDRLSVLVATLGWSRAAYVEFVTDERLETLLAAHERAFLAFGRVPRMALYDNMRTVVLQRDCYGPGLHRYHPAFLDFARHCGFRPRLCQPYWPRTTDEIEQSLSAAGLLISPRPWVTAWHRAGHEVQALPRSHHSVWL